MPRVSVVMSAYNEAGCVGRALQSLRAQTLSDWELLFVDDGSTDATAAVAAGLADSRIQVLRHERNMGIARSRNEAVARARGEYVAIFDADDVSRRDRLELQVRFLDAHPEIAACGASGILHAGGAAVPWPQPTEPDEIRRWILRSCPIVNSSLMARAEILKKFPYDPSLKRGEDHDLFLRLARRYPLANLPEPLIEFETSDVWGYRLVDQWWKLRVRWRAFTRYGYPWSQAYWLLAFVPALLVPPVLKRSLRASIQ